MNKNFLTSCALGLSLFLTPAWAQNNGDAPSTNTDINVSAPAAPSAPAPSTDTNIRVEAPDTTTAAPSTSTESTTVRESNTTNTVVDEPNDQNWGIIVGAGLIGLTVLALLLNSRRSA